MALAVRAGPPFPEIQEAAERLNRLVGNVLDITRFESGHVRPLLNECDVIEIVNLAVAETEKQLGRHPFSLELPSKLPIIRTDYVFLQQALINLLSNAAVHTLPGTPVVLRVWLDSETLFLSVADRGPGIKEQHLSRIFDKFYRLVRLLRRAESGLGLSLVKGFVKAVEGNVTAANREGGGAEFTITLPLAGPARRNPVVI